jgi:hypothetical protein
VSEYIPNCHLGKRAPVAVAKFDLRARLDPVRLMA